MSESGSEVQVSSSAPDKTRRGGRWWKRILLGLLVLLLALVAVVVGALFYFKVPANSAGLAAQTVCSGTFVAGRAAQEVFTEDVLPQSPALSLISMEVDQAGSSVTAKFLGVVSRQASLLPDRGCVLDLPPDPAAQSFVASAPDPFPWPQGDAAVPESQWGDDVDTRGLRETVDAAFVGASDPTAANTRALAVVHNGKLLVSRQAEGFLQTTPLLGWSMTKTVNGMLAYKALQEAGVSLDTPVIDAFPAGREPPWVAEWRGDERGRMTVQDLFTMNSGLDFGDDYGPLAKVVKMLYSEPSMADYAASQPASHEPGTYWEYSTGVADILSQVVQGQFAADEEYWRYPGQNMFEPIGVDSATLASDTSGTWVGGSYLWADTGDWARLGLMMMSDGKLEDARVLPAGWWDYASTPASRDGEGNGYGAQTWRPGAELGGECHDFAVPPDTLAMQGHYGQLVAMVPSREAVIVRLGWTIDREQFDSCQLIEDVLSALPE